MKQEDFLLLLRDTHRTLEALTMSKGAEYAGSDDQLANFKRLASALGIPAEKICYTFLAKHLDSIQSFLRKPGIELAEPIDGRIDDAILYLVLLKGLIRDSARP